MNKLKFNAAGKSPDLQLGISEERLKVLEDLLAMNLMLLSVSKAPLLFVIQKLVDRTETLEEAIFVTFMITATHSELFPIKDDVLKAAVNDIHKSRGEIIKDLEKQNPFIASILRMRDETNR